MSLVSNGRVNRTRNATHRRRKQHELRVVRSLASGQPELEGALRVLEGTTSNTVRYKAIGEMGVTLVMMDPLIRRVLAVEKGRPIPPERLKELEQDMRLKLGHAEYRNYEVPIDDPISPLALYGADKRWLGIQLSQKDYRLRGDRTFVEHYFSDNYDLSRRQVRRSLADLRPHVTIGEVQYSNLEPDQAQELRADPSGFIIGAALDRQDDQMRLHEADIVVPVVFPEAISLNGLQIVCQQKGS